MWNTLPPPGCYVCPADGGSLCPADNGLRCARCGLAFGSHGGILDLDIVRASEREAFDERFRETETMSEPERAASLDVARRFMTALGTHPEPGARILDVACGNGALTFGLLASGLLTDSDVFCFDHSVESMRVFLNTASQLTTSNRLYASSQDVHRMAYPEHFFDVVFGNAVLHHFLEYEVVLEQVRRILKPGATAIFAEPVGYGYLWAVFLMRLAAEQARKDIAQETQTRPVDRVLARVLRRETSTEHKSEGGADSSRLGLLDFIVENTFYRLEHHDSKAALSSLTDKHYFLYDEVANLAARLGFQVRFASYEPPEYYGGFMRDMLTTYHVADPAVAEKAYALYAQLRESLPSSLHRVMSHFQFFILKKVGC